jgi:arylsulfatase A-like enzyme
MSFPLLLLCILPLQSQSQSQPVSRPASPHLIVLCAVDQLPAEYLVRFRDGFTEDGFRRILREGVECSNAGYEYAITETGPGHATIGTGANPHRHGIIANEWLDRATHKAVYCVDGAEASSARHLLAETLGDRLKIGAGRDSTVVSASIKDRSAILMAGRRADGVWWFDRKTGDFCSAPEFRGDATLGPRASEVVRAFNQAEPRPIDAWRGKPWQRLLDPADARWAPLYAGLPPDDAPFEMPWVGWGRTFDHVLPGKDAGYYYLLYGTPFANEALLSLTVRLLDDPGLALGRRQGLDLLCVSFSASDPVGHAFGSQSHEVLDIIVRLDRQLAQLLQALDRTVGAGRWTLALSADHGATPPPEYLASVGAPAGRLEVTSPGGVLERVAEALARRFKDQLPAGFKPVSAVGNDRGKAVLKSPFGAFRAYGFYLAQPFLDEHRIPKDQAAEVVRDALREVAGIAEALTAAELQQGRFPAEGSGAAMRLSFHKERSGDVLFCLRSGWVAGLAAPGFAATHGGPWGPDQRVPVLFLGPGFAPGRRVTAKCSPADIVPTLCARFGVVPPALSDGRVVEGALAR